MNKSYNVSDLKNGDKDSFEAVFLTHAGSLERFAYEYVANREEAIDIVQSVFLVLWENRTELHETSNISNYLITLTKNKCLNYLRHCKARFNYQQHEEASARELLLNYYALERFNENKLITEELSATIQKAINSLPPQCREMFLLSRFEGLTYAEIAKKCEVSVKTVEKKMSQSLEILRLALKEYFPILAMFL